MKLGYLSGPVDARKIYDSFVNGAQTALFGTSYLRHFMRVCEEQRRSAVIITTHAGEAYEIELGRFTILNRPQPGGRSLRYHLSQVGWMHGVIGEMEDRGVGVVVLTAAIHYWWVVFPFRRRGMKFINSLHGSIRALSHKRLSPHEALIRLTSRLHLAFGDPTMVISPTIRCALSKEAGSGRRETFQLLPDYDRAMFADFGPPSIAKCQQDVVNVIFAGRVTENKGVFDLLTAAEELARRKGPAVHFHIHGEGEALDRLRETAASSPARDVVHIYGFTGGSELKRRYADADIVVVPTRSDLEEGLAKSVVEGVLALRPTVTSRACPSIHLLSDACVEAEVDQPISYADVIWQLATDPKLAERKTRAALQLREMFFDPPERYDRQLKKALAIVSG